MKALQFTLPVTRDKSIIVQEDHLPWFYNHLHRHPEIQITLVIKGEGTLIMGNSIRKFKAGDIFIIGANQPHIFKSDPGYFRRKNVNNTHSIKIFLNPRNSFGEILSLPEMKKIKNFLQTTSFGLQVPKGATDEIAKDILKLIEVKDALLVSDFIKLLYKLSGIKHWKLLSTGAAIFPISDSEGLRINDIYQYTMENFSRNISLEQISQIAHLTVPAFCRYFKKHTNKTYITFLNEIRINNACNKLIDGNFKTISAIAYDGGFENITTFNRLFKKRIGISPREYARKYIEVTS